MRSERGTTQYDKIADNACDEGYECSGLKSMLHELVLEHLLQVEQ
jgi:hypothetical protein